MDYKALRDQIGVSQQEAADFVGVTAQAWSHWENGIRQPNRENAYNIITLAAENDISLTLEDIFPRNGQ